MTRPAQRMFEYTITVAAAIIRCPCPRFLGEIVNWSVLANWCLVCSQGAKEQWQLCALTFPLSSQSKATVTMTITPVLVGNNRLGCWVSYNDKKKTIIDQLVFMFMYCCFLKAEEGLFSERQRFPTALWQLLTHLSATDSTSRKYFDTWDGCAFVFFDKTSLQHNSSHYLDTSQLMEVQSNGGETVSGKTEERQSWQSDKQGSSRVPAHCLFFPIINGWSEGWLPRQSNFSGQNSRALKMLTGHRVHRNNHPHPLIFKRGIEKTT